MKDLLETLSVHLVIKSIFYPFKLLNEEIEAISLNRHRIRSFLKILIILTTAISGIYLFYHNLAIKEFFLKLTAAFNLSIESQPLVATLLAIITSFHVGSYLGNVIVRSTCNFIFGDPDFYVTKNRAIILEQQFKEQGNNQITKKHICEVIDFCRKNLRRKASINELGTKPEDWKKTIECLLYDADLDHFLDQQQALKSKQAELQKKLDAIQLYKQNAMVPSNRSTYANTVTPLTNSTNSSVMETSFCRPSISLIAPPHQHLSTPLKHSFNKTERIELDESTPLLHQYNRSYSPSLYNNIDETIAIQELNKFKKKQFKKSKYYSITSDECMLRDCKRHLQLIELKTEQAICPESLFIKLAYMPDNTTNEESYPSREGTEIKLDPVQATIKESSTPRSTADKKTYLLS